ncbi:MAG: NAD-dependent malic enzyme, partial [Verrucomicrobiae bacterium]|nr:NAD-dependent malic enzyme [Verrucomicrobiae bacterium]
MRPKPSVSYSFTIRLRIHNQTGMLARVLGVIAAQRGDPGAVDLVRGDREHKVRDLTVNGRDE